MSDDNSDLIFVYSAPFHWKVEITYFKKSGKYYTTGEYISKKKHLFEIFEEVREMLDRGVRPGLVEGPNEFYATIDVPDHPHDHPALIIPNKEPHESKNRRPKRIAIGN